MNKAKYTFYTLLLLFTSLSVYASPSAEVNDMSLVMLIFIPSALVALFITYLIWKLNMQKRRQAPKTTQRGPVKKPIVAYQRKRSFDGQVGMEP